MEFGGRQLAADGICPCQHPGVGVWVRFSVDVLKNSEPDTVYTHPKSELADAVHSHSALAPLVRCDMAF